MKTDHIILKRIQLTLQLVICVLIGQEIAIPPNPYTNHLILALTVFICLKHDIPTKIIDALSKLFEMVMGIVKSDNRGESSGD
jgi:hypothetical protein